MTRMPGLVVLVSGRGSNLQALLDARARGELPVEFLAVISNQPNAPALDRAAAAGVPVEAVDHRDFADRESFDRRLMEVIDGYAPDLVVLAGFMRIFTDAFIAHYGDRMLNIHPSLLPAFRGLHTHRRAIEAGVDRHGATVHFVTPELDGGPAVIQATVPVLPDDDAGRLAERVLTREHRIYPLAVRWFAEGRLRFDGKTAWLDDRALDAPVIDPAESIDESTKTART
jgi:phosphoribosylglycinamide formyltransferase-1